MNEGRVNVVSKATAKQPKNTCKTVKIIIAFCERFVFFQINWAPIKASSSSFGDLPDQWKQQLGVTRCAIVSSFWKFPSLKFDHEFKCQFVWSQKQG